MKLNKSTVLKAIGVLTIVLIATFSFKFLTSNTAFKKNEVFVLIPSNSKFDDVVRIMKPLVKNTNDFIVMANLRSYSEHVKPGRFLINKGMNAFQIVSALRRNVPVDLAFNNQERLENLCERLSSQIEPDTTKLLTSFRDTIFLKQNGFNKENVFSMFLPNTYQVYWNISADEFREKMLKEYHKFWNKERLAKASALNLTPIQVMTLASIVHKETVKKSERQIVAGVYLNRLNLEMPLQADPTVIYAMKLKANNFNQIIKRVLYNDLFINSPYNTYKNLGLPPGPIAMPDMDAIEAVLNPQKHNYIYFCASVERFGYHEFAATLSQHNINAKKYANWMNSQGMKR